MTKIIILGEEPQKKKQKIIKFSKVLKNDFEFGEFSSQPCEFDFIELICKNYHKGVDLMFAHNGVRSNGCLFLGHFNDGVV
jgi:hypothetical protein